MKDIIEIGISENKSSLIFLSPNNDEDDMLKEIINQSDFLTYKATEVLEAEIRKIIQFDVSPLYLIVNEDSILALLETDELVMLKDVMNGKKTGEYKYRSKMKYINEVFKLYNHIKYGDTILSEISPIDTLIRKEGLFYGNFLLAKLYNRLDKEKAYELYQYLWTNTTSDEIKLYTSEYLEIMREKDKLIRIKNEDVYFDYVSYDFGHVKVHEEVECKFYYTNKSNRNFIIYSATSTCGCTIPLWNKKPLRSGERDSITVKLKVDKKSNILKTVTIKGNTDTNIHLRIKATAV